MKRTIYSLFLLVTASIMAASCSGNPGATTSAPVEAATSQAVSSAFNADSAYSYIASQTAFGPRVPGSEAHSLCAQYLTHILKSFGADTVICQRTTVTAYNGDRLPICNIMGRFNPEAKKRVLLLAHWDSRPWADAETDPTLIEKPIDGANDGASGVAALLEIARNIGTVKAPAIGVDILFVDAEDYGRRADEPTDTHDDSWALGSQYWAQHHPYTPENMPLYGILLDMVGGKNAVFHREYFSEIYARHVNNKVWTMAQKSGFANRFPNDVAGAATDDHVYINAIGIPTIDIIEMAHPDTGSFNPTWHTHADTIEAIDKASLAAVGTTVLNTLYSENQ